MDPFAAERVPGSRPRYADVDRIRSLLEQSPFSAVIAAWPENVGYLSGFYHPDMRVNWERLHLVIWPSGGNPAYVIPRPRAEGIWSLLKRSMVNFAAADVNGLVRIIKRKLKKIQYRPHLIDGCLAATGLKIEPR